MAKHRSDAERAKWVSRFRASGLSCDQFAGQHGLSASTLYRWSQRGARDEAASGFAEVRVVGAVGGASLEVVHPSGCVVRVSGAVDEARLTAVLRALGWC
jgi:transposase-like protein